MPITITIDPRFCGPPDSGNGGYVCGMLANHVQAPVEVTLRKPPPLSKPVTIIVTENRAQLLDGETLIAEAAQKDFPIDAPAAPDFESARNASRSYKGFESHVFPTCFVCGPQRKEQDGLRIFAGRVEGKEIVAAPWMPDASLADKNGIVRDEFHWAALDCPGYFSISDNLQKSVLGKMAAKIYHRVRAGERCVVTGWLIKNDGRKHFTGTALFSEDGKLAAVAQGVWIDI